jgi:nicotinamidase-related amidase
VTAGRLAPDTSALAVIDWQERLFPAMPEGIRDQALARAETLLWLAGELAIPVVASVQYPKGLGPLLPQVDVPQPAEKTEFSAVRAPAFAAALRATGRSDVLVTGMETHICVAQTARDLVAAGFETWVAADACLSRRKLDWELGLERIRADGGRVVTTEAALFELVGRAGTPLFKELSRRIK